jgi:hypothetical protein
MYRLRHVGAISNESNSVHDTLDSARLLSEARTPRRPFKFLNFFETVCALFVADLASERECARLGILTIAYFAVH